MIGARERETNGIESAKMITWVSVFEKSEKCSAYSEISIIPMEFDLPSICPNNSCIFRIRSIEDRIINASATPLVSIKNKGSYSTHSWSFRSGHGIRFAPLRSCRMEYSKHRALSRPGSRGIRFAPFWEGAVGSPHRRYGTWAGRIENQRYAPLWEGEGEEGRSSDCWTEFRLLMSSLMRLT
jgi:hypothetical protein